MKTEIMFRYSCTQDADGQIGDLHSQVMKILITKGATASDPASVTIMIEGTEVVGGMNVSRACTLLIGLIYVLNLSYPREMMFLKLAGQKTTPKVTSLMQKMLTIIFEPRH